MKVKPLTLIGRSRRAQLLKQWAAPTQHVKLERPTRRRRNSLHLRTSASSVERSRQTSGTLLGQSSPNAEVKSGVSYLRRSRTTHKQLGAIMREQKG